MIMNPLMREKDINTELNVIIQEYNDVNAADVVVPNEIKKIVRHANRYNHYQTFIGVSAHSHGVKSIEIETLFEALEICIETPDVPQLDIKDEDEE